MELTSIDFIIIGIVLFLSIKGFFTGFTVELLSLFGLIGGIGIASRTNVEAGKFINDNIYPITDKSALELVGFIVAFLAIWAFFNFIASFAKKGVYVDIFGGILGYFISIIKFIAIFGVILYGLKQSQLLVDKLFNRYQDSVVIPIFLDVGSKLLNQDKNITFSNIDSSKDINLSSRNLR